MPNLGIPMPNLVPDRISGIQIVSHQLLRVGGGGFYVPIVQVIFLFSLRTTEFLASKLSQAFSSHNLPGEGLVIVLVMFSYIRWLFESLDLVKHLLKKRPIYFACITCRRGAGCKSSPV